MEPVKSPQPKYTPQTQLPGNVAIIAQGGLLEVQTTENLARREQEYPSKRGAISGFSRRSRNRLLKLFARLDTSGCKPIFITLTYPREYPDAMTAKTHLQTFLKRIRRRAAAASGVWRLEFQQRGAPHFHLIMFNLPFIPKDEIQTWWGEIIAYQKPFTRIEAVRGKRHLMSYVSKYVAKESNPPQSPGQSGFIYVPYLTAGRHWGVFNREGLPYAVREIITISGSPDAVFYHFRRSARRKWRGVNKTRSPGGFSLFTDDPYRWLDLYQNYAAALS